MFIKDLAIHKYCSACGSEMSYEYEPVQYRYDIETGAKQETRTLSRMCPNFRNRAGKDHHDWYREHGQWVTK